jgi:hypothetical protein
MHFNMSNLMILGALIASFVLVVRTGERIPALIALVVSGLEALIAFRLLTLHGPAHLDLILAAALAAAGVWAWMRVGGKPAVTAATVVALVGAIQFLVALGLMA